MAAYEQFDVGGIHFPLEEAPAGASLLSACDPALSKILAFLAFRIDRALGDSLTGAVQAGAPSIAKNVRQTFSTDALTNIAKAEQFSCPFLAVFRHRSRFEDKTTNWRQDSATLGFSYVLPAMTLEQAEKYSHVLHAVAVIIEHSLYMGFDPAYEGGERLLDSAGISSAKLIDVKYELFRVGSQTDTQFHAVTGDIGVVEQIMPTDSGLQALTGMSVKLTDESVELGNPVDLINARR